MTKEEFEDKFNEIFSDTLNKNLDKLESQYIEMMQSDESDIALITCVIYALREIMRAEFEEFLDIK